jgi:hypothetical protein
LRFIHLGLRRATWLGRSGWGSRLLALNTRRRATEALSGSRESLVLWLRLGVFFLMLFQFNIHLLSRLNIHNRERGTALSNTLQDLSVARVIRSVELTIVN